MGWMQNALVELSSNTAWSYLINFMMIGQTVSELWLIYQWARHVWIFLWLMAAMFFEGPSRKMNLLFDTPLPLCYCEIRLAPVSVLPDRGPCVCVWVSKSVFVSRAHFAGQPSSPHLKCNELLPLKRARRSIGHSVEWCWFFFLLQNRWKEESSLERAKHSDETNREKMKEQEASRGMKRGWDVLMGTMVSVASCVCESVKVPFSRGREEGRVLALTSHWCQWTKSPVKLANLICMQSCRLPPTQHHDQQHKLMQLLSGFSSHSPLNLSLYETLFFSLSLSLSPLPIKSFSIKGL